MCLAYPSLYSSTTSLYLHFDGNKLVLQLWGGAAMEIIRTTNWPAGHQAGFKKLNTIVALKK